MKKVLLFGTTILALIITSCSSQTRDNLPSDVVKEAVEEQMKLNMLDQSYTRLQTGYFECNNEDNRIILAKLAAAGVIEYKVERFAWWKKHLYAGNSFGTFYGGTSYKFEEHFMVSVKLTEEGKKFVVDSIPTPEKLIDEDLKQPEIDLTKLPENNFVAEQWPDIPCPENKDAVKNQTPADSEKTVEQVAQRSNLNDIFATNTPKEEPNTEQSSWVSLDVDTELKYLAATEKVNIESVIMKSSALEVDDVRFIQTFSHPENRANYALAEVIAKTTDVTPAGRIIDQKYEGTKLCATVIFEYFNDKGWVLRADKDLKFSPTSEIWETLNSKKRVDSDSTPEN